MTGTSARVSGHTLRDEGAVYTAEGHRRYLQNLTGYGHGMCSCGALSPVLPSRSARKRWHREHKAEVLAQSVATPAGHALAFDAHGKPTKGHKR